MQRSNLAAMSVDDMGTTEAGPGSRADAQKKKKKWAPNRKPAGLWDPFNVWWRARREALAGKRPPGDEVASWWKESADRTWGAKKPTEQETRKHAKCLRSKNEIVNYFRVYRGNKKKAGGQDDDLQPPPPKRSPAPAPQRKAKAKAPKRAKAKAKAPKAAAAARAARLHGLHDPPVRVVEPELGPHSAARQLPEQQLDGEQVPGAGALDNSTW